MEIRETRDALSLAAEGLAAGGALVAFVVGARTARSGHISPAERTTFATVNAVSSSAWIPLWTVMQLGSLGGALGVAAVVAALGHRQLAVRVAAAGTATWVAAKVVKQFVRRGRPSDTLEQVRVLGRDAAGLGYPSGHAAVASTMAVLIVPALPRALRPVVPLVALTVGASRVYVGAHLPLDVAGGIAFGTAIGLGADVLLSL